MKVVTSAEMREIDRISIEEIGIPSSVLMNNAGKSVAEIIMHRFKDKKIIIFCGTGNNGGDGFTVAYYLLNNGMEPVIYLSGKKNRVSETSKIFLDLCGNMNLKINEIDENNISTISINKDSVIVDAILGTGFEGIPKGIHKEFIKLINSSDNKVISIDVPSGLNSDGMLPSGECIKADFTVTIGLPKISLVTYPCKSFCGELTIVDIGFPSFLTSDEKLKVKLINESFFRDLKINNSDNDIHKGERGHTLLIGGFNGMEGAAILTASALFNTGAGLVTIATENESRRLIAGKVPEAMTLSLPDDPESFILGDFIKSKKITTLIIGPGLGRTSYSEKIFRNTIGSIIGTGIKKVLIDGDGLFFLADFIKYDRLPADIDFIITPHFMEASRILMKDIDVIKSNRLESCKELAGFYRLHRCIKRSCNYCFRWL